jgi:carbamoyl-phosphate synthase large subunit
VFLSVNDFDKPFAVRCARGLQALGFRFLATRGTADALAAAGVPAETIYKVNEGRPNVVDKMLNGEIQLVINTPLGEASQFDETAIRKTALPLRIPLITTLSGAAAALEGIKALGQERLSVMTLQELHGR